MEQQEADRKLANGEVNAEIIVPRGFASRLRGWSRARSSS